MDSERISELGLEPMLTTSELAEYLGVHVQAIYDLRADGGAPPASESGESSATASPTSDVDSTACTRPNRR